MGESKGIKPSVLEVPCRVWCGGTSSGTALVSRDRLSFWGGFDPRTGRIVDRYSELCGQSVAGRILVFTSTKGSSGTSGMLALAQRAGNAPNGMINIEIDCMAVLGCLVTGIPLVSLESADPFALIQTGDHIEIDGGRQVVRIRPQSVRS